MASKTNVLIGERESFIFQIWSKLLLGTMHIKNYVTT
jgi:hypothetical protein